MNMQVVVEWEWTENLEWFVTKDCDCDRDWIAIPNTDKVFHKTPPNSNGPCAIYVPTLLFYPNPLQIKNTVQTTEPLKMHKSLFPHHIIEGTNILDKDITAMLGCTHTNKENESKESINNNNKYTRQRHYYYLL